MPTDAGRRQPLAARRPGRTTITTALAVVLVLAGATALVVGLAGRGADPPPALPDGGVAATPAPLPSAPADGEASQPPAVTAGPSAPSAPSALSAPSAPSVPSGGPSGATTASPPPTTGPAAEVAEPVAVRIPAIDVSSDLLHLGLRDDGTLEVPEGPDFDTAAWFDGSPRPGEVGPAVIEGHVSSRARGPSVFHDLAALRPGDLVEVGRADGTTATFEVYELQQFPKDEFPTLQVYGNTEGPELRLITCGGSIAESSGRFEDNVIVFAAEVRP